MEVLMNGTNTHGNSKINKQKKGMKSAKAPVNSYHGHHSKNNQYVNNSSYGHQGAYNYPSWTVFDEQVPQRKGSYNNHSSNYNNAKYNTKSNYSSAYEQSGWSTQTGTGSENEGNINNELDGFKISQGGRVIHNEAQGEIFGEDLDSTVYSNYFAASVLTIGPNSEDISLPSFL